MSFSLNARLHIGCDELLTSFNGLDINRDRELREETRRRVIDEANEFNLSVDEIEKLCSFFYLMFYFKQNFS